MPKITQILILVTFVQNLVFEKEYCLDLSHCTEYLKLTVLDLGFESFNNFSFNSKVVFNETNFGRLVGLD